MLVRDSCFDRFDILFRDSSGFSVIFGEFYFRLGLELPLDPAELDTSLLCPVQEDSLGHGEDIHEVKESILLEAEAVGRAVVGTRSTRCCGRS